MALDIVVGLYKGQRQSHKPSRIIGACIEGGCKAPNNGRQKAVILVRADTLGYRRELNWPSAKDLEKVVGEIYKN